MEEGGRKTSLMEEGRRKTSLMEEERWKITHCRVIYVDFRHVRFNR